MKMETRYSRLFRKQYDKASVKIRFSFGQKLQLFIKNPHHPLLRNHELKGEYVGYRSINVTGDWRALYSEKGEDKKIVIVFETLGTHSQLYR